MISWLLKALSISIGVQMAHRRLDRKKTVVVASIHHAKYLFPFGIIFIASLGNVMRFLCHSEKMFWPIHQKRR